MKIFRKKEKQVSQDPITYLNKKKDRGLFFVTSSWGKKELSLKTKERLKKIGLISLPVMSILLGTVLGIVSNNLNKDKIDSIVTVNQDFIKRRIYLISSDNFSVPLTIKMDKKNNIYEEMLDVIDLLKISSSASNDNLRGYIPNDARVNSFELKDNNLYVNFSEEFLSYTEKDDKLFFNSLISTLQDFDEVDTVSLQVEGRNINDVINANYDIVNRVTYINNINNRVSDIENKELVTVFYERTYSDDKYLIPISLYAEVGESLNVTFANGLMKKLPSSYCLNNVSLYETISKDQSKSDDFSLTVTKEALIDEQTVNKDLYELVAFGLHLMGKEENVSFNIEGETLLVDGIYSEEDKSVSSIYYNEIEI